MTIRNPHVLRLVVGGMILFAALLLLPRSAAFAAPAVAVYRGEALAASGPGQRIELRLSADGAMSWLTDYRNNRAPISEEGRWNPITVEDIEVIIERKDAKPVTPTIVRFVKRGDTLSTTPESAVRFGSQGLQLKQAKAAAVPAAVSSIGAGSPLGVWQWEGLVGSAERISVNQPERYILELQSGGKALVRADCNRGQAGYKLGGRGFSLTIGGMTRAACPAGSLSGRYLKALEAAVGQRIKGNSLFLDLPGEGGSMKFVRAK